MTWEAIGAIGEIVGAAAVVLTLIYFSLHLRQGTSNIRAASYQSASQGRTSFRMAVAGDKELTRVLRLGLIDPSQLDEDDLLRFHILLVEEFRIAQSAFFLKEDGLADPEFWEHERFMIATYKKTPAFDEWWRDSKQYFSPKFIEYVESEEAIYAFAMERAYGVERNSDQRG